MGLCQKLLKTLVIQQKENNVLKRWKSAEFSLILLITPSTNFKGFPIRWKSKNLQKRQFLMRKILFWKTFLLNVWGGTCYLININHVSFGQLANVHGLSIFQNYHLIMSKILKKKIIWIWWFLFLKLWILSLC